MVGDSVTTDHISPAGSIKLDSPAGGYLRERGVEPVDFNSYGSRRGNHEVMMRGTFANVRLRNEIAPGTEGAFTTHLPSGEVTIVTTAAERYRAEGTPLVDARGQGVRHRLEPRLGGEGAEPARRARVIAESYERIHRSNLVGMGVLPLQYAAGESAASLGLSGRETFSVRGLADGIAPGQTATVDAVGEDGASTTFDVTVRIDAEAELEYFRAGGILRLVLAQMLRR